jgi:hypothetical protein
VYRDPSHFLVSRLSLTGMQSDTDGDTELSDRGGDRLSSMKRLCWLFECREESISSRINLSTVEPAKLSADRGVVRRHKGLPLPIPEPHGEIGRADDVGEEHCGDEASVRLARLVHRASLRLHAANGSVDGVQAPLVRDPFEKVSAAIVEHEARAGHEIAYGARDEHFSGLGQGGYACADRDSNAGDLAVRDFAFA